MKQRCVALKIVVANRLVQHHLKRNKSFVHTIPDSFFAETEIQLLFTNKNGRKWSNTYRIDFVPYFGAL